MSSLLERALKIQIWLRDPNQFFRDVTGLEPSKYQKEILDWCKDLDNSKLIIVAGTGSGKSVTPDTVVPVIIDNGLHNVPIGSLDNISNGSTFSVNKNGKVEILPIEHVIKLRHTGKIFNIKTNTGRTIRVTPDHGLLTFKNGEIERIAASDVEIGTLMPIMESIDVPVMHTTTTIGNKEVELDWDLGFLIGSYLAEGSIGNGKNGPAFVSITNGTQLFRDKLETVTKNTIGCTIHHYRDKRTENVCNSNITNAVFARYIYDNFSKTHTKKIAGWAFLSPIEFRKGLLSGYFTGDGEYNRDSVDCTSVSMELRNGIGMILSSMGVTYSIGDRIIEGKKYYRLSIGKPTLRNFIDITELYDSTKQNKVNTEHTGQDYRLVPMDRSCNYLLKGMKRKERNNNPIYTEIKRGYAGKNTLSKQLSTIGKDYDWLHTDVFFDKIVSIEKEDYDGWVYDIDTGDNTFCTSNGLFVHNTFLLAVLALWTVLCMPSVTGRNVKIAIASGGLTQAKRVYDYIVQFCNYNKMVMEWVKGEPLKTQVTFKDNSWIAPMASSSSQLYNLHADVFIIDEAAVAGDEVIEHSPRVVGSSTPNRIIISGHFIDDPKVYISKFAEIWQNDEDYPEFGTTDEPKSEWKRIHFTSMDAPWMSTIEIETARKLYSREKFDAVFKGILPELTGTLFDLTAIRKARSDKEPGYGAKQNKNILAVDWGFKGDPTALLVLEIIEDKKDPLDNIYNTLYAKEYKNKTGPWMQVEIDKIYTQYKCIEVRCDSSHSQENYRLRKRGMVVKDMVFRAIKRRMQERLRVVIQRELIIIWKGYDIFLKELVGYGLDVKKNDHLVDCAQMATWEEYDHTYGNIFVIKRKYGGKRSKGIRNSSSNNNRGIFVQTSKKK